MYCTSCGGQLKENSRFCEHCGTATNASTTPARQSYTTTVSFDWDKSKGLILYLASNIALIFSFYVGWFNLKSYYGEMLNFAASEYGVEAIGGGISPWMAVKGFHEVVKFAIEWEALSEIELYYFLIYPLILIPICALLGGVQIFMDRHRQAFKATKTAGILACIYTAITLLLVLTDDATSISLALFAVFALGVFTVKHVNAYERERVSTRMDERKTAYNHTAI